MADWPELLRLSSRIRVVPVIHGSGDFAIQVRQALLSERCDCVAIPLPEAFRTPVLEAVDELPSISVVVQRPVPPALYQEWTPDTDDESDAQTAQDAVPVASYVPIDPCQPVIAGIRLARQERWPVEFIDYETESFQCYTQSLPDPYTIKRLPLERFVASVLPLLSRPTQKTVFDRCRFMAARLRSLEERYSSICLICSILEYPWIKDAYDRHLTAPEPEEVAQPEIYSVAPESLTFVLGELPFLTGLYERARAELEEDDNLSVDGLRELLLTSREKYREELKRQARDITPALLATYLRYVRNLCLIERRMTPDLYSLVVAAQQIAGDQFALQLVETAKTYPYPPSPWNPIRAGVGQAQAPGGDIFSWQSRLPGVPVTWRTCHLHPRPQGRLTEEWQKQWNPYGQCSWPPEDVAIERFRTHVKDQALQLMGHDLIRSEKFTTSLQDGLDLRETLRNWHTGDLYVKILPPSRGHLDCVIMLFDSPADPRDYPWRVTWMAEAHDESTLALFASDFRQELIGPGIGLAKYGGAMFLFPPRPIPEIWTDPRFDFTTTLEERLIAAAACHSEGTHVALLSPGPPGFTWRTIAKKYRKKLVHIPLSRFSQALIQQLRLVHVLNGKQIRSFAADFIRKA